MVLPVSLHQLSASGVMGAIQVGGCIGHWYASGAPRAPVRLQADPSTGPHPMRPHRHVTHSEELSASCPRPGPQGAKRGRPSATPTHHEDIVETALIENSFLDQRCVVDRGKRGSRALRHKVEGQEQQKRGQPSHPTIAALLSNSFYAADILWCAMSCAQPASQMLSESCFF